ncbi:MAG: histidine phosphatase family protein [Sneathiella sp.]
MLKLTLMRHGNAELPKAGSPDKDRRLTHQGKGDVSVGGAFIRDNDLIPDFILCSDATRTRETLSNLKPSLRQDIPTNYSKIIYSCSTGQSLIHLLEDLFENHKHVLLIGHNPTLHEMALMLTFGRSEGTLLYNELRHDFATSSICHIELQTTSWQQAHSGGDLVHFVTPRR